MIYASSARIQLHTLLLALLLAGIPAYSLYASEQKITEASDTDFRADEYVSVPRVIWPFFVETRKDGDPEVCSALSRSDLRVKEDGIEVRITNVDRKRQPVHYAFLLDTSSSTSAGYLGKIYDQWINNR